MNAEPPTFDMLLLPLHKVKGFADDLTIISFSAERPLISKACKDLDLTLKHRNAFPSFMMEKDRQDHHISRIVQKHITGTNQIPGSASILIQYIMCSILSYMYTVHIHVYIY